MNPLFAAAAELQDLCERNRWGFCFIGGLAVLRWGEPRLTLDVDVTILAAYGSEIEVVDELLGRFPARIDDARPFALENRVVLLRASNRVPIDVALGAMDFESRTVQRASAWKIGEASLRTCSAEDLVVHKAFAGRDRDWGDVEGIVSRQGEGLDLDLILNEAGPLLALKGTADDFKRLRSMLDAAS